MSGTVTVGPREALAVDHLSCIKPRWCGTVPTEPIEGTVQLRAHGNEHRARITPHDEGFDVVLLDPADGIAPGQACVVYVDTRVVGSATIAATRPVPVSYAQVPVAQVGEQPTRVLAGHDDRRCRPGPVPKPPTATSFPILAGSV